MDDLTWSNVHFVTLFLLLFLFHLHFICYCCKLKWQLCRVSIKISSNRASRLILPLWGRTFQLHLQKKGNMRLEFLLTYGCPRHYHLKFWRVKVVSEYKQSNWLFQKCQSHWKLDPAQKHINRNCRESRFTQIFSFFLVLTATSIRRLCCISLLLLLSLKSFQRRILSSIFSFAK